MSLEVDAALKPALRLYYAPRLRETNIAIKQYNNNNTRSAKAFSFSKVVEVKDLDILDKNR